MKNKLIADRLSRSKAKKDDLPDYLKRPSNFGHKYGELKFAKGKFVLTGEPIVLEYAKRVFPGCRLWRGEESAVVFGASSREIGDLNWLMMRFPLEVHCQDKLEGSRKRAVKKWQSRISGEDLKRTVPPPEFIGKLYPYQEEAVTFLANNKRALLGDSMGLGKTWSSLAAAAHVGEFPVLVVCQTHVQLQWQRAIGALFNLDCDYERDMFDTGFDVSVKRGKALAPILKSRTPYDIPDTPFSIIHYGLLSWWDEALMNRGYPSIIFDEVQELRHGDTAKYSAASLLSSDAEYVCGASGTPVYGYGAEIWSVMNSLEFHCLGSRDAFTREWCTGYGESIVSDPKALNGHLVREGLLIRRRYENVELDIPPVSRMVQDLQQDDDLYDSLIASAKKKASVWLTASFHEKGRIAREVEGETRRAAGISKARYVADFVASLIEAGEKPLVYAWHHDVHRILKECLARYKPMFITGKQTQNQKDKAIRAFLDRKSDVVILSLRSAAGLDGLQYRATCCVFAELDWSPAIHGQCESRIARIGVDSDVREVPSYYCVSRSGFDEIILDVLGVKTGQFVGLMGDEPEDYDEKVKSEKRAQSRIKMLVAKLNEDVLM